MRLPFPKHPTLDIHNMGPLMIPVGLSNYGLCDKYSGLYVEFTSGVGVFVIGEAYESMRESMTIDAIIDHFRTTGYMIQNTQFVDPDRDQGPISITNATVTPVNTVASIRSYVTHLVDRGGVAYVAAVPNSVTTAFGFALSATARNSAVASSNVAPGKSYPNSPSYTTLPPAWNMLRGYQIVPLNTTRRAFLAGLAASVDDADRGEVQAKCSEAITKVIAALGQPDRPLAIQLPFVLSSVEGVKGVFVEPVSTEHNVSMYTGSASAVRQHRPAGILDVVGFNFKLPQVPVMDTAGYGWINYGLYGGEDAASLTITQMLPTRAMSYSPATDSVSATTPTQGGTSLTIGKLERPALDFGIGHVTHIFGPLATKFHFVDVATPDLAVAGTYKWSDFWAGYLALFVRGRQTFAFPTTINGLPTSEFQYTALMQAAGTKGSNSAYFDLSTCTGIDPRVLATAFGQALSSGGVSLTTLTKVHPSLTRLKVRTATSNPS